MLLRRPGLAVWAPFGAVALAALWPLSAYLVAPVALPAALAAVATAALIIARPEYGIALVLAMAPLVNAPIWDQRPLRAVVPVLAFAVLAYGLLERRREHPLRGLDGVPQAVLLLIVAVLLSAVEALDPAKTLSTVGFVLTAGAVFASVVVVCTDRNRLVVVAGGAVAGLLVAAIQGIAQEYTGTFASYGLIGAGEAVGRVQGAFGHPNAFGGYLAVLVPVALALVVLRDVPGPLRGMAALAVVLAAPALAFSYSRGAIVALGLGSLIWLGFMRPRLAIAIALLVAVVAATALPGALRDRFTQAQTGDDVALRADIWGSALDIAIRRPVLGVGPNNFDVAYARLPQSPTFATQRRLLHNEQLLTPPHAQNLYLNVLAELGLVGLLAFAAWVLASIRAAYRGSRVRDTLGRGLCLATGAALMTLAVQSLLDATLFGEVGLPIFALTGMAAAFVALDARAGDAP